MALLLIAVTWMLLAGVVVALCRAASLGEDLDEPSRGEPAALADVLPDPVALAPRSSRPPVGPRRRLVPGHARAASFTKSSRRRAGLHRA
jgi:hypothetical protein